MIIYLVWKITANYRHFKDPAPLPLHSLTTDQCLGSNGWHPSPRRPVSSKFIPRGLLQPLTHTCELCPLQGVPCPPGTVLKRAKGRSSRQLRALCPARDALGATCPNSQLSSHLQTPREASRFWTHEVLGRLTCAGKQPTGLQPPPDTNNGRKKKKNIFLASH